MLTDWELWACATLVEKQHGERAPFYITERLLTLAAEGDQVGLATWQEIAERLDQLRLRPAVFEQRLAVRIFGRGRNTTRLE